MGKKIIMTIMMILCMLTLLWPWFGNQYHMETVYGTILLENPVALASIILTFLSIWIDNGSSYFLLNLGFIGMISMEIFVFMTWPMFIITDAINIDLSIALCYPQFYYALFCLILTYIVDKKIKMIVMKEEMFDE